MKRSVHRVVVCAALLVALLAGSATSAIEGPEHRRTAHDQTACQLCVAMAAPFLVAPQPCHDAVIIRLGESRHAPRPERLPGLSRAIRGARAPPHAFIT